MLLLLDAASSGLSRVLTYLHIILLSTNFESGQLAAILSTVV